MGKIPISEHGFAVQWNFEHDWTPKKRKKWRVVPDYQLWLLRYQNCTENDLIYQIALYLLIWGEANNVRFMPECLCFIYQCALDYNGPNLPKFHFLDKIITPIYNFIRDQLYCQVDSKWRRKEIDHARTIGYDDVNQHFWSTEGLYKLAFEDGNRLYQLPRSERYQKLV